MIEPPHASNLLARRLLPPGLTWLLLAGLCATLGTLWSSWHLLAAAVCWASASAWRVTHL